MKRKNKVGEKRISLIYENYAIKAFERIHDIHAERLFRHDSL